MPATPVESAPASANRVSAEIGSGVAGWPILGSIAALVAAGSRDPWTLDAPVVGPWWAWLSLGVGGGLYHLHVFRMAPSPRRQVLATVGVAILGVVVMFVAWRAHVWTDSHPLDTHSVRPRVR